MWSRSFIRLIGGFILSKSGVIYTHADIDVYISNSNISSNCIIIKTMGAASRSDGQCDEGRECRGTRVLVTTTGEWPSSSAGSSVRVWARLETQGLGYALCLWPAIHRNT